MVLCPHCEKALGAEHDEKACRRRMSRRFFFGLAVAPLAAAIAAKLPPIQQYAAEIVILQWANGHYGGVIKPVGIERILAEMVRDGEIKFVPVDGGALKERRIVAAEWTP